jgi:hypothetical protein
VEVGALRKPKFTSGAQQQAIEFDNVDDLKQFADGSKATIEFDLCEINLTNWAIFDAGMVTQTTVAGTGVPVVGEAKGTGWTQGVPIQINNKNGANTMVTAITVRQAGVAMTLNTDYRLYVGNGTNGTLGFTYIVPITAQAAAITADYTYTPAASKVMTFTSQGNKTLNCVRFINTDAAGKNFQVDMQNATNVEPFSMTFAGDDEADVAVMPVKIEGYIVSITDEQQVV